MPSAEAEAFLANQLDAVRSQRTVGPKVLRIVNAYAAGINGYYRAKGIPAAPFTANDVVASAALIAARFGTNGGQEAQNAMFLDALRERLGEADARRVFADLREANDPESPVSVPGLVPAAAPVGSPRREASCSTTGASPVLRSLAAAFGSNALLVGAKRSKTGHPLFVAGPQVGYFFPEFFAEMELAGAGFAVRGAVFPGVPTVLIGRGPDFAWSATSSQADNLDVFVETLCQDDRHYVYQGQCEPMRRFFAGTLRAQGQPDQEVCVLRDDARPGRRLRDGRRDTRRDLRAALDAWPRVALDARLLRPQYRPRDVRKGLPRDDERGRVQLQLVLRRRPRHRAVLERKAAGSGAPARTRPCRRSGPASTTGAASCRSPGMRRESIRGQA